MPAQAVIMAMMTPMVEELARCVVDGIVDHPQVADHACLMGLGFPQWRGGPLFWAHQTGFWLGRDDDLAIAAQRFY